MSTLGFDSKISTHEVPHGDQSLQMASAILGILPPNITSHARPMPLFRSECTAYSYRHQCVFLDNPTAKLYKGAEKWERIKRTYKQHTHTHTKQLKVCGRDRVLRTTGVGPRGIAVIEQLLEEPYHVYETRDNHMFLVQHITRWRLSDREPAEQPE